MQIFDKDCLVRIGTCIAPRGHISAGEQREILTLRIEMPEGKIIEDEVTSGTIKRIPLSENEKAKVMIKPKSGFDVGKGSGNTLDATVEGGVVGIIVDTRGRPFVLPVGDDECRKKLIKWFTALDAYPEKVYKLNGM